MSSGNILKSWFAPQTPEKTVVIDTNNRMVTRLQEYEEQKRQEQKALMGEEDNPDSEGEFVAGLFAEKIETFTDEEGNVVYQSENGEEVTKIFDSNFEESNDTGNVETQPYMMSTKSAEEMHAQWQELEKEKECLELAKTEYAKLEEALLQKKEEMEQAEQRLLEKTAETEAECEQKLAAANEEADRIRRDAKADGYQEGYEEAHQKAMEELDAGKKSLEQEREQLKREYDDMVQELEPQFAKTFCDLYRHIFHVDFSNYQDIVTQLILSTFQGIDSGKNFIVHVSKADYERVNEQKKRLQEVIVNNGSIEVIEDYTLKETECLIETEGGIIDCSLDTQLEQLEKEIKLLAYKRG